MPNSKPSISEKQKVWRFVEYDERFGYDSGNTHITTPEYVRWYINGWTAPSMAVVRALGRLRAEGDFIWLQGAVIELLAWTAAQERPYQGYLLTGRQPASATDIGSMLRVDGRKALVALGKLCRCGLLEQVPFELWAGPDSSDPNGDYHSPLSSQKRARASRKGPAKDSTKRPSRAKNKGAPFNKTRIEKHAAHETIEIGEGPPGQAGLGQGPANGQSPPDGGQSGANGTEALTTPATRPATSTTSTSPDAGAGPALTGSPSPGRNTGPASIIRLGQVCHGPKRRYSAEAMDFAGQVLTASGYVTGDRGELANELAHWAKAWDERIACFDAVTARKIKAKVLTVAAAERGNPCGHDNPQAYINRAMNNEIIDAKRAGKGVG